MTEPEKEPAVSIDSDASVPVAPAVEASVPDVAPSGPGSSPALPVKRGAPEYEFTEKQNDLVGALAAKMTFVGTMMIVFGALLDLIGLVSILLLHHAPTSGVAVTNIVAGAALFCVGFWTRGAAVRFQQIVDTEGSDVTNLMSALEELFRIYSLQRVLFLFTSALAVVAIVGYIIATP